MLEPWETTSFSRITPQTETSFPLTDFSLKRVALPLGINELVLLSSCQLWIALVTSHARTTLADSIGETEDSTRTSLINLISANYFWIVTMTAAIS